MGMIVEIYRGNHGDCTNGGASSKVTSVCVVNVEGPFNPSAKHPAFRLVRGAFEGQAVLEPVDAPKGKLGPMFGGNMAHTCDSRFGQAVRAITGFNFYGAVPIHDRYETQEDYNRLCA